MLRHLLRTVTAGLAAATLVLAVATPGSATPGRAARVDGPDLALTIAFDKASYGGPEPFVLTFTFTNLALVPAQNVHDFGGDSGGITLTDEKPTGFDLAGGQTRVFEVHGVISDAGVDTGIAQIISEYHIDNGDVDPDNNVGRALAPVIGALGSLRATFYDSSGPLPGGEEQYIGVECGTLTFSSIFAKDVEVARATSGADGTLALDGLPVGVYIVLIGLPAGYKRTYGETQTAAEVRHRDVAQLYIGLDRTGEPTGPCPPPTTAAPTSPAAEPALAVTGTPALRIGAAGAVVLVVGIVLLLFARRRRSASTVD
jgi:hypothetical protein